MELIIIPIIGLLVGWFLFTVATAIINERCPKRKKTGFFLLALYFIGLYLFTAFMLFFGWMLLTANIATTSPITTVGLLLALILGSPVAGVVRIIWAFTHEKPTESKN